MDSVRLDRWLFAARIFPSRTAAQEACEGGRIKLNGASVKPAHALRVGDEVRGHAPRGAVVLRVLALSEKRLAPAPARALYEDHSPPPPPRDPTLPVRDRGAGRPTKADRRALLRWRQG